MKKIGKTIGILVSICMTCLTFFGCGGTTASGTSSASDSSGGVSGTALTEKYSWSDYVENVKFVSYITGKNATTNTLDTYSVGGTDLGFPIYNSKNNKMYYVFGDTFLNPENQTGLWRSNVMAYGSDMDYSDGITYEGFKSNGATATSIIEGMHTDGDSYIEVTKIPTGGIEIDGTMYLFYMSIRHWITGGGWEVNYNGVVKSTDNGETWTKVFDLTWVESDTNKYAEKTQELINKDVDGETTEAGLLLTGRVAPGFGQIFPVDGKDGYIYIFGIPAGRSGGMKMGRVEKENFENFDEYEYFTGRNSKKQAVYVKGSEGLKAIEKNFDTSIVISPSVSEFSVFYNAYLGRWIIMYFASQKIVFHMSKTIDGVYSDAQVALDAQEYLLPDGNTGIYGGLSCEQMVGENGKKIYFIVSLWKPIYQSALIEMELL